jgi:hypothetical protein
MSANRIAILMLGAVLVTALGLGQDGPNPKADNAGRLVVLLPYDAPGDRMRQWASDVAKHAKSEVAFLLVADDPAEMREDRLIEIAQAIQDGLPGITFSLAQEKELEMLARCKVTRLPAYLFSHKRKLHVWQGAGQWHEILSCSSK